MGPFKSIRISLMTHHAIVTIWFSAEGIVRCTSFRPLPMTFLCTGLIAPRSARSCTLRNLNAIETKNVKLLKCQNQIDLACCDMLCWRTASDFRSKRTSSPMSVTLFGARWLAGMVVFRIYSTLTYCRKSIPFNFGILFRLW
jgi:hypothetical protein